MEKIPKQETGVPQRTRGAIDTIHSYMRREDAHGDTGSKQAETPPEESLESADSPEAMSAEKLAQEIFDLTGTEISIFGTYKGLDAPLNLVMGANGLDDAARFQIRDTEQFEHGGGGRGNIKTGFRLKKTLGSNPRKVAELVRKSQDNFGRDGFKGIRIIFPQEDEGLADRAADDESVYQNAIEHIWQKLGERIHKDEREFFVPKQK